MPVQLIDAKDSLLNPFFPPVVCMAAEGFDCPTLKTSVGFVDGAMTCGHQEAKQLRGGITSDTSRLIVTEQNRLGPPKPQTCGTIPTSFRLHHQIKKELCSRESEQ